MGEKEKRTRKTKSLRHYSRARLLIDSGNMRFPPLVAGRRVCWPPIDVIAADRRFPFGPFPSARSLAIVHSPSRRRIFDELKDGADSKGNPDATGIRHIVTTNTGVIGYQTPGTAAVTSMIHDPAAGVQFQVVANSSATAGGQPSVITFNSPQPQQARARGSNSAPRYFDWFFSFYIRCAFRAWARVPSAEPRRRSSLPDKSSACLRWARFRRKALSSSRRIRSSSPKIRRASAKCDS